MLIVVLIKDGVLRPRFFLYDLVAAGCSSIGSNEVFTVALNCGSLLSDRPSWLVASSLRFR